MVRYRSHLAPSQPQGSLYEHPYRASRDIKLQSTQQWNAQYWRLRRDLGAAQAAYVSALIELEKTARAAEVSGDLVALNTALMVVVEAANKIGISGYTVNWEQNTRWALQASRFGLSGYAVVDSCDPPIDRLTLTERLEILGTLVFRKQLRRDEQLADPAHLPFSKPADNKHGAIMLSRVGDRYASEWLDKGGAGQFYRILSD